MFRQMLLPVLLLGVVLAGGASTFPANEPAAVSKTAQAKSKLKELLKERLATLRELVKVSTAGYEAGKVPFERVHHAMMEMLRAELESSDSDKDRIAVLEKIVAQAKGNEQSALQRYKAGAVTQSDALMAAAARLEAEIALERVKSNIAPAK
ncbi:MAG: hypothetical protein HY289_01375 [Planctomycetes bacterium]|nr:hypothetical protein [Planctomycetota bacterium]